jgi:hypothetical protein
MLVRTRAIDVSAKRGDQTRACDLDQEVVPAVLVADIAQNRGIGSRPAGWVERPHQCHRRRTGEDIDLRMELASWQPAASTNPQPAAQAMLPQERQNRLIGTVEPGVALDHQCHVDAPIARCRQRDGKIMVQEVIGCPADAASRRCRTDLA